MPQRGADVAVPCPEEHFSKPLALALGGDHDIHAPGTLHFLVSHQELYGHRGVLADDGASFAGDPNLRFLTGIVGVAAVLPIPAEAAGFRCVVAEHAAVERFDGPPVLRP